MQLQSWRYPRSFPSSDESCELVDVPRGSRRRHYDDIQGCRIDCAARDVCVGRIRRPGASDAAAGHDATEATKLTTANTDVNTDTR